MGDVTGRGRAVGRPLLRVVGGVDRLDAVESEGFLARAFFLLCGGVGGELLL